MSIVGSVVVVRQAGMQQHEGSSIKLFRQAGKQKEMVVGRRKGRHTGKRTRHTETCPVLAGRVKKEGICWRE